jgi:hypothetical protein
MASIRDPSGLTEDLRARLAVRSCRGQASVGHGIHCNHCGRMRPLASILLGGVSARLGHYRPQGRELLLVLKL